MIIVRILICLFFISIHVCCSDKQSTELPSRWLEDIAYDIKKDKKQFTLCHGEENVYQYHNLGGNVDIEGDKPYILNHFEKGYHPENKPRESGLIRIRFIVNCNGETDRFRTLESDLNYKPKKFHSSITQDLLSLTKSLKGWKQKLNDHGPVDYYQYLIFKIEEGSIRKILP